MKRISVAAVIVAGALLVAGCNGGKGAENASDTAKKAKEKVEKAAGQADSTVGTELDKLLAKRKDVVFSANYDFKTTKDGKTTSSGKQVMYFKYPNMRMDLFTELNGTTTKSMMYQLDQKSYMCSDADGTMRCLDLSSMAAPSADQSAAQEDYADELSKNMDKYKVKFAKEETIANEKGLCYDIASGDMSTYTCFTTDGILLKTINESAEMNMSMIANEIFRSVDDAVFTLPAEPTAMPKMPEGMPQGMPEGMPNIPQQP